MVPGDDRRRPRRSAAALWSPRSVRSTNPTMTAHPPAVARASASSAAQVVLDERRSEHQVLGRVAGDRELGEARRRRRPPSVARAAAAAMRCDVAVEVADRGVDLAERDAARDQPSARARTAGRRATRPADVEVVRLPDEVGAALAVPDHRADEALEVVARLFERPRVGSRSSCRPACAIIFAMPAVISGCSSRRRRTLPASRGRPLEDLVVQPVGLLGHDDVLLERGADLVHLLGDHGRPILDPAGRRRGQRLLQVHEANRAASCGADRPAAAPG